MPSASHWLTGHSRWAPVSQGHVAQSAVTLGSQTGSMQGRMRGTEEVGLGLAPSTQSVLAQRFHFLASCHPPWGSKESYFPTAPPAFLPLPLPQPQLPLPCQHQAKGPDTQDQWGRAIPPACSLETPGDRQWAVSGVAAKHSPCSLRRPPLALSAAFSCHQSFWAPSNTPSFF